jgi:hypothetical protein
MRDREIQTTAVDHYSQIVDEKKQAFGERCCRRTESDNVTTGKDSIP